MLIRAGRVLVGGRLERGTGVLVEDGRISAVGPDLAAPHMVLDLPDAVLAPGFVDLHVHALGGCGVLGAGRADLPGLSRALAACGVTGFLATTVAAPVHEVIDVVRAASAERPDADGARCLGVHLEGPWLNADQAGAQPVEHFRVPSVPDLEELLAAGPVAQVTLAPELPGGLDLIAAAVAHGVVVALGHSDATYADVEAAVAAGARHVTHCFNAMRPLHHREPGLAGAALDRGDLTVEVIADGVHVHPGAVRLLWRARGTTAVCFVSDAVDADLPNLVVDGTVLRRADGRLAGSRSGLDTAVRNAVAWDIPLADALTMASTTPADVLGRSDLGRIEPGAVADLVLLDPALGVHATIVGGALVHERTR